MSVPLVIVTIVLSIFVLIILFSSIKTVRPTRRGLVERFGKYNRFANPGIVFVIPFGIERLVPVNITEKMVSY